MAPRTRPQPAATRRTRAESRAMQADRRTKIVLLALAALSALRVVVFALLDRRPLFGGWEAPDLQRAMFYHYGLRAHLDWTFAEQIARDGFKPPLWYGGVPLLFGWKDSLGALDFLLVNAAAMAATVLLVFALGRRLGGARGGLLAAATVALLPGVAWRIGMVGVEQTHMALLPFAVLACVALVEQAHRPQARTLGIGVVLGLTVGVGLLVKWNFGAYIAGPALLALVFGLWGSPRAVLRGIVAAALVATAIFLAWLVPFADLADIVQQGVSGESGGEPASIYLRELVGPALGPGGWLLLGLALAGALFGAPPADRGPRPARDAAVIASAALGLLLLHALIPHKETRYLLPALPLLVALLAWPLGRLAARPRGPAVAWGGVVVLGALSWGAPLLEAPADRFAWSEVLPAPIRDAYEIDALVAHPSLRERERTVVTFALTGQGRFPLLTFLHWELYGRNPNPVLSRSDWDDVTSKACAFDLERSTHFVAGRPLDPQEQAALRSMGFELVIRVLPRIDAVPELALWALAPTSAPRYR